MALRYVFVSCMAALLFAVGWYDFNLQDDVAVDLRVEYRAPTRLAFVRPSGGIELTTDGAVYLLGGFHADVEMTRR